MRVGDQQQDRISEIRNLKCIIEQQWTRDILLVGPGGEAAPLFTDHRPLTPDH